MRCLGVAIQRGLVLLEELLLDRNIVIGDAKDDQAVLRLARLLGQACHRCLILLLLIGFHHGTIRGYLTDQFILDQNKCLHRVLKGQLVLAHLGENGADVEVDVARVRNLQAVIHSLLAKMQVVVLDFEGLFKVGKRATKLLCSSEYACEIVISNGSVSVALLRKTDRLVEQLQAHLKVLLLQEAHREDVADDGRLAC